MFFYKKIYCNGHSECKKKFEKILLKKRKGIKGMGNYGFIGLREPNSKVIFVYRYARIIEKESDSHSEPDIISLLEEIKPKKNWTVYFSSHYSSCLSCLDTIICFLKAKTNFKIYFYYWKKYDMTIFPKIVRFISESKCMYFQKKCEKRSDKEKCTLERYEGIIKQSKRIKNLKIINLNELEEKNHYADL